jgi:hypothetical protein
MRYRQSSARKNILRNRFADEGKGARKLLLLLREGGTWGDGFF